MQILMGSGKVDVNAAVEGTNETILHILARKSDKSNFSYNVYIECLKYALRSPGVNVDAIEKTASMTPLFIATDESKSKEAAIALIKAGKFEKKMFNLIFHTTLTHHTKHGRTKWRDCRLSTKTPEYQMVGLFWLQAGCWIP